MRGQEMQTLKGHDDWIYFVAFHPDGKRLASAGAGGKLFIWDARPAGPTVDRQREALGLVEYLCSKSRSKESVVGQIRTEMGITDEIRQEALLILNDYWPRHTALGR